MLFKKQYIYILSSFILLLFSTTIFIDYVNKNREIYLEPDDFYHYLIKSSNLDHCKNQECFEENLFKKKDNLLEKEQHSHDRQVHRLVYSYHPLYTFLLNKISNKDNVFESQKKFHIFLGVISALFLLIFLCAFLKNKQLLLVTLAVALHYYMNNWGLKMSISWSVSAIFAAVGMIYQFKNKILSSILFMISVLLHPIGLVMLFLSYLTYCMYKLVYENKLNLRLDFILYLFRYGLLLFAIFLLGYYTKYTAFDLSQLGVASVYSYELSLENIINSIKDNFEMFFKRGSFTILLLNPILLFFFIATFFCNISKELNILKIFTLLLIISYIFFIIPGGGGSLFTIGKRTWSILIINYTILSIATLFYLSKINKFYKCIKFFYFLCLPLFLLINISYNLHPLKSNIDRHNNYYDIENKKKFKDTIDKDSTNIIYFNSSERLFYSYLISGFIQNNFIFKKSYPPKNLVEKANIVIMDSPISLGRSESDLVLENNSVFELTHIDDIYELILYSKYRTTVQINKKKIELLQGFNQIKFEKNKLTFDKIYKPIRILGLIINEKQKTNWPWFKNVKFRFTRDLHVKSQKIFFYKNSIRKVNYEFDFNKLSKKLNSQMPKCNKNIISDIDSSIILSINCLVTNNDK
jgi:hypothetical protein